MKIKTFLSLALPALLFCSCINSDYDFSDIDTTVNVRADNLVVPLKLDAVTLDKVINVSEGDKIRQVVDPITGDRIYAVLESGSFSSSPVNVPAFTVKKPAIPKIETSVDMTALINAYDKLEEYIAQLQAAGLYDESKRDEYEQYVWNLIKGELDGKTLCKYDFEPYTTSFRAETDKVDKAIRGIENVTCEAEFDIDIELLQLAGLINVTINDLKLGLPKGLDITLNYGSYDPNTGIVDLTEAKPSLLDGHLGFGSTVSPLKININAIDAAKAGITITPKDNAYGTLAFAGEVKVLSGDIEVKTSDLLDGKTFFDLPKENLHFTCTPELSAIDIKTFTGKVKYDIDDVNINPIALDNLPDILDNGETDIILGNPQIYITTNNPVAKYDVKATAGFQFCGERQGVKRPVYELDNKVLDIEGNEVTYCLSPVKPEKYYEGFTTAKYEPFSGLKNILTGGGLPDKINVDVVNPCIPEQHVTGFVLDERLAPVEGSYTFFAPLALDEGSLIIYETTEKDWDASFLEKLVVEKLTVSAVVTSEIPLGATVTVTPLDRKGNEISGVSFDCQKIEPNAQNQTFEFVQKSGQIRDLDGVTLRATIVGGGADKALKSVQKIEVKNLKATVSGFYEDEL